MRRDVVAWAALLFAGAALVAPRVPTPVLPAAQGVPDQGQETARELSRAFNAVAGAIQPSVVQINVKREVGEGRVQVPGPDGRRVPRDIKPEEMEELLKRFFGGRGEGFRFEDQQFATGTGSGFVFDEKGHILTNNHVVEGAEGDRDIVVTFHDGTEATARVVGTYPDADVAVIQVEKSGYPAARIGTSKDLKVGDWVLAVGSPFGLSQTVTAGIVSATERENLGINRFESFIQTDASINPGNSGGPLVDIEGRVVGINSAIATSSRSNAGVGFAIPIDMAVRLAGKLIEKGKITPVLMGVTVDPLSRGLARTLGMDAKTTGVLVTRVGPGTPAEKAGLREGDVIVSFDGTPVRTREGLQYLVWTSEAGKSYEVSYLRDGQAYATQVSPAEAESVVTALQEPGAPASPRREAPAAPVAEADAFGLAVTPLTAELAEKYGYAADLSGLVVTRVAPDSPAAESGIEVGDLITRYVQERQIRPAGSVEEFQKLVDSSDEISVYLEDVNHRLPGEFKTLTRQGVVKD
jgi:serine protease Do